MAKAGKVIASNRLARLDLDSNNPTIGGFKDSIHFDMLLRSIMKKLSSRFRPCQLSGYFSDDEIFYQWAD